MYVTGPYITGPAGGSGMASVLTPEEARRLVAYWAEEGVSWLKFYTTIDRASMRRSEEHTSELQSRQYLVCRLLLEKKKTQRSQNRTGELDMSVTNEVVALAYKLNEVLNGTCERH